jgi:molybdenum-dependent DNA-binding transcriptional regulator ModE
MPNLERAATRLTPRDLRVFLAVAEEASMARAATRLAVSRPVISRTIADLEHFLGVRLLDRLARGVTLTLFGESLRRRAIAVMDELRRATEEIATLGDPHPGSSVLPAPKSGPRWTDYCGVIPACASASNKARRTSNSSSCGKGAARSSSPASSRQRRRWISPWSHCSTNRS